MCSDILYQSHSFNLWIRAVSIFFSIKLATKRVYREGSSRSAAELLWRIEWRAPVVGLSRKFVVIETTSYFNASNSTIQTDCNSLIEKSNGMNKNELAWL
jgi:hypothetical protein